ncbi:UNVERIFIED_CONTAM: hypothetical protein HDU68_012439 [Siphonaria sp. JEL0065]|nr:hypothetical protein HDU68_012439 [Siphonaria sp. JEL0065]
MFSTSSLPDECTKAAQIISQFVLPEFKGTDTVIPSDIISKAKGLAILQVTRIGFHISGRIGSGVVIAKLPNGNWSAPSVCKTAGMGIGAMLGAEITDVVMVLNTDDAVAAFHKGENITLGGNLSVAAGPIGRSAEAGATLIGKSAPIFSYSKTKGLYAGMSFEGSSVTEGKDANAAFYGRRISAREILCGAVPRPQAGKALYQLSSRVAQEAYRPHPPQTTNEAGPLPPKPNLKNDVFYASSPYPSPPTNSQYAPPAGPPPPAKNNGQTPPPLPTRPDEKDKASIPPIPTTGMPTEPPAYSYATSFDYVTEEDAKDPASSSSSTPAPTSQRPLPIPPPPTSGDQTTFCIALYDYTSVEAGDLQFKTGDVIRVSKKNADGWWFGSFEKKEGAFPSTYVRQL